MALNLRKIDEDASGDPILAWDRPNGQACAALYDKRGLRAQTKANASQAKFEKGFEPYEVYSLWRTSTGVCGVEHGVYTGEVTPPPPPPTGAKLRDKPPGYPDYPGYVRITHDGRGYYNLDDSKDYLFVNGMGDFSYSEGVYIEGGRNVVVIGGRITATGLERGHGVGLSLRGRVSGAHHYIEGVRIRPAYSGSTPLRRLHDGIATRGGTGKITIQNCLVGPVAIKEGFTEAQGHADVLQVQAGPWEGELRVHRLTGMTDYTGVMESEILVRKQNWHQVNLKGVNLDPAEVAWTTFYANNSTTMAGLSLTEFYCDGFSAGAVPSSLNNVIKRGLPPGGDFVTEAMVALPYVSPGYV